MFCYVPPVTYFSPKIYNDYENGTPGTFQTFSFGTDVRETSAVRFVGKKRETMSNAGIKLTYPLVFGTKLATKSVVGNAVLNENYCFFIFFFLNPLEYVLTAISQSLVFIGYG